VSSNAQGSLRRNTRKTGRVLKNMVHLLVISPNPSVMVVEQIQNKPSMIKYFKA